MHDTAIWPADIPLALATAVLGYLLGSIPFGLILAEMAGYGDIRKIGSGNIGATNVLRTGSRWLAALTLCLDAAKGALAVAIAYHLGADNLALGGLGALLGHIFPFQLNFKGGKGVATYLGVIAAMCWPPALAFAAAWILTAALTRYSSLAALVGCCVAPVTAFVLATPSLTVFFSLFSLIVIARHHENIARLLRGTESKIGGGRQPKPDG
jgi:glycerol-3-phosphate acyltransferase PlsY